MNHIRRAAIQLCKRSLHGCLAFACVSIVPIAAQSAPAPASAPPAVTAPAVTAPSLPAVLSIDGPWRFQIGDDPRWADPAFDDSTWRTVSISQSLTAQGFAPYSGYAWYRIRITPQQLTAIGSQPAALLVTPDSVGQIAVYINGVESGHTRGMRDSLSMYVSPPFIVPLPAAASGPLDIAVRTGAGPSITISRGLLTKVEIGSSGDIANRLAQAIGQRWNENVIAALIVAFLFLCVSGLGAALYFAQRHHSEYLWLALLCLSVAFEGGVEASFQVALLPYSIFSVLILWTGRIFMVVTLEFVLRFTASPRRRLVRGVQIAILLLPFLSLLHLERVYEYVSVASQIVFCALIAVLLFVAWRRDRRQEAGVMLLPFLLAAVADSTDTVLGYAASRHWVSDRFAYHHFYFGPIESGTGTITFLVFLASLIAVILYRFIRVSQEEQRSNAEIAAARSVQALLIPTQLPSNKNFMLESAYLPIHGVGGDFFQVLPLQDESLLIVVGDVSGKGLQAAMNSSTLVGALRNELSHDPATILCHLNRVLLGAVSSPGAVPELDAAPCFATCLCARIYADGVVTIANAGHLSPYRDGRELELLPGLPLGVIADSEYEQSTFQLSRGDRLVFLSDGVVEAANAEGELFGFDRTRQVSHESARYIASTAQRFGQTDDITVVSIYIASRAAQRAPEEALQGS